MSFACYSGEASSLDCGDEAEETQKGLVILPNLLH